MLTSCDEDYVLVNDIGATGEARLLEKHCNQKPPTGPFYSSWNKMQIVLVADKEFSAKGFYAHYSSKTFQLPESVRQYIQLNGRTGMQ